MIETSIKYSPGRFGKRTIEMYLVFSVMLQYSVGIDSPLWVMLESVVKVPSPVVSSKIVVSKISPIATDEDSVAQEALTV